jgi:hypothetical protein
MSQNTIPTECAIHRLPLAAREELLVERAE